MLIHVGKRGTWWRDSLQVVVYFDKCIQQNIPWRENVMRYRYNPNTWTILGLRPANERRRYFVTTSLIGWAQN